ncbi:hypothetical protein NDK43_23140 [Neobacillus pocheonensis]|uniref:Uncharacterized protein n=1 Tax=Neobacillus pocheonensis TaxID=363869 RepID=A0ABT0WEF9_9BACI|nr:hypothetical protein [Neobacillus pocheonensis]
MITFILNDITISGILKQLLMHPTASFYRSGEIDGAIISSLTSAPVTLQFFTILHT